MTTEVIKKCGPVSLDRREKFSVEEQSIDCLQGVVVVNYSDMKLSPVSSVLESLDPDTMIKVLHRAQEENRKANKKMIRSSINRRVKRNHWESMFPACVCK